MITNEVGRTGSPENESSRYNNDLPRQGNEEQSRETGDEELMSAEEGMEDDLEDDTDVEEEMDEAYEDEDSDEADETGATGGSSRGGL